MSIDEALETLRETNAYGTMDIAKGIILNHYANQKTVIEDIRAEIGKLEWYGDDAFWDGVNAVSDIIDRHIGERRMNDTDRR